MNLMNPLSKLWVALFLFGVSTFASATQLLDTAETKALFTVPLGSRRDPSNGWIDIAHCRWRDNRCVDLVHRIPLRELKMFGKFEVEINRFGDLDLFVIFKQGDKKLVGKAKLEEGWYGRFELCRSTGIPATCKYTIERDEKTQGLSLTLLAN